MTEQEEFFIDYGDCFIQNDEGHTIKLETMYQMFKQRMLEELQIYDLKTGKIKRNIGIGE